MAESKTQDAWNDELLSAYLDGELSTEERAAVDARLNSDAGARELLAELTSVSESLKELPQEKLGIDLRQKVLDRATVSPSPATIDTSTERRWIYAATAIAAALLLMFYQGEDRQRDGQLAQVGEQPPLLQMPDVVIRSDEGGTDGQAEQASEALAASPRMQAKQLESTESELGEALLAGSTRLPNVELIGDQLLGDAPLEHLHVSLRPQDGTSGLKDFESVLRDRGVLLSDSTPAETQDERSQSQSSEFFLVEAPLAKIQQLLSSFREDTEKWNTIHVSRKSEDAPALSFFQSSEAGNATSTAAAGDGSAAVKAIRLGSRVLATDELKAEQIEVQDSITSLEWSGDRFEFSAADVPKEERPDSTESFRVLFILLPAVE